MALVLLGAVLGLMYIARTIRSARLEDRTPTLFDQLVVLGMLVAWTVAVIMDNQTVSQLDTFEYGIAALSLVFALLSSASLVLGRQSQDQSNERAYLGVGIGLITIAVAFVIPLINDVTPDPTEVAFVVPTAINDGVSNISTGLGNQRLGSSRTRIEPAPTQTPISLNSTIPSPIPPDIYFFTPTPTPEGMSCTGVVTTDLNVRRYPSVASGNIVAVAPKDDEVLILGRNESTSWWFISFEIYEGWVDADFVEADETCESIPARPWS